MKQQLLLRAYMHAALALIILSLPLWSEIKGDGLSLAVIILLPLFFGYSAYSNFKKANKIDAGQPRQPRYAPPANATINQQIQFYTRFIYISLVAFPALTWLVIDDLNTLESGAVESVRLWAPVAFLYGQFGYKTAILAAPVLGVMVVLGLIWKVYVLRSEPEKLD